MAIKRFAFIAGLIMLVIAVLSLIPGVQGANFGLPALKLDFSYGLFLGIFPMNILNKLALIVFGIMGIVVSRAASNDPALTWSRWVFFGMGLLAILGIIPQTNTLFGYWPLFGSEIALHAIFALLGGYFGFVYNRQIVNRAFGPNVPAHGA